MREAAPDREVCEIQHQLHIHLIPKLPNVPSGSRSMSFKTAWVGFSLGDEARGRVACSLVSDEPDIALIGCVLLACGCFVSCTGKSFCPACHRTWQEGPLEKTVPSFALPVSRSRVNLLFWTAL